MKVDRIIKGDCIKQLAKLEPGSVDLAFADPPFNIGYAYDTYNDSRSDEDYLDWSKKWMAGVSKALKPTGAFWLAIGDEYAAELKVTATRELGFTCRSWVIWYYTFGVNCKAKFTRSHAHLFHFVRDAKQFTFNDEAIRVPSARQLVYADKRANPKGRLPDDTWIIKPTPHDSWILRPQDLPEGFAADSDTWYFPRVCGTFEERTGFHGCQMPEHLLARIIRACSNEGELVLDPFSGSATTLAVAKKLNRRYIGFEISDDYVKEGKARLKKIVLGNLVNGSANPMGSAPSTTNGRALTVPRSSKLAVGMDNLKLHRQPRFVHVNRKSGMNQNSRGVVEAFIASSNGLSIDWLLADKQMSLEFVQACKKLNLEGDSEFWLRDLLRARKQGAFKGDRRRKSPHLNRADVRACDFASEIAHRSLQKQYGVSLDALFCNLGLAKKFDKLAHSLCPGYSPIVYRWAALGIRKRAHEGRKLATQKENQNVWRKINLKYQWNTNDSKIDHIPIQPGVYVIGTKETGKSASTIYIGESENLQAWVRQRIENDTFSKAPFSDYDLSSLRLNFATQFLNIPKYRLGYQCYKISKQKPQLNFKKIGEEAA